MTEKPISIKETEAVGALIVGAGISGIRAALDLAECGHQVVLIDRSPYMGGVLAQLDNQFPNNHCGMCKMLPLFDRDKATQQCLRRGLQHDNIDIRLSTELVDVTGEAGEFAVTLRQSPRRVDPHRCWGCGLCEAACPVSVPDTYNAGMVMRKAIYLPTPQRFPNTYVIDTSACNRCGACVAACPFDAIQLIPAERKTFRVLVVDDELIIRESLKEWLEDEGFSVETAASGPAALEILRTNTCQMMLLDIKMPGMDGVAVLEHAKADFSDVCVLMMTAYATVETAVAAMKTGATDYLLKPFDPEDLIPKIIGIYETVAASNRHTLTAGAVILAGGVTYFDPSIGKNPWGYGVFPNVVTNLEFERILSGSGPSQGRLERPSDARVVKRVAWIQCVGSRDIQYDVNFCSSICCMAAVKQALLATSASADTLDAAIFYMDMRTYGKSHQDYRDAAAERQVRFVRSRIHSVVHDDQTKDLILRYARPDGAIDEERFDLVVLSVGQQPAPWSVALAEKLDLPFNPWGFPVTLPFSPCLTEKPGVLIAGSFSGLKSIGDSVIHAGAAAMNASRMLAASREQTTAAESCAPVRDVARETPRIEVVLCTCRNRLVRLDEQSLLKADIESDPAVQTMTFTDNLCTADGWPALIETVAECRANRVLIAACAPFVSTMPLSEVVAAAGLPDSLVAPASLPPRFSNPAGSVTNDEPLRFSQAMANIKCAISGLQYASPLPAPATPVCRRALVVGGGIAGLSAALALAEHGHGVDVIEKSAGFGGQLNWLHHTLEGHETGELLKDLLARAENHSQIQLHPETRITGFGGEAGCFSTTVKTRDGKTAVHDHAVTILATGGEEAVTTSYSYGKSPTIVTQKELSEKLDSGIIRPADLSTVVMIQCVDSREPPRNYCSRVCCPNTIKQALFFKSQNPDLAVIVFYRDIMTVGFSEAYYTEARNRGVMFIPYRVDQKPEVVLPAAADEPLEVHAFEPIVGRSVAIETDLVVLATGIVPRLPAELADQLGVGRDRHGFFQEADSKWRPLDALREGIFACGLTRAPCAIADAVASGEAAAQRALRILSREQLLGGRVVAGVRASLCSHCERCVDACPYNARTFNSEDDRIYVNPALCQGCGACAAVCPNDAAVLSGYLPQQMLAVIDAVVETVGDVKGAPE